MSVLQEADALSFLHQQQKVVSDELGRLGRKRREHERTTAACARERDQAWSELGAVLVPTTEAPVLDGVAQRLRLPGVAAAAAAKLYIDREAQLRATLGALDTDPRFRSSESLLNACEIRRAGVQDLLAPLATGLAALDGDAFFSELVAVGYGTASYGTPWWRASYYRHWKNADDVVERWKPTLGCESFVKLRETYEEQQRAAATLKADLRELDEERASLQAIATRHAETTQALATLASWWQETLRGRAVEHLRALPEADRFALLGGTDDWSQLATVTAKKVSALEAKVRYLEEAREHWLEQPFQDLQRTAGKLANAEAKVRRKAGRTSYDQDVFQSKYGLRTERWNERWQRYDDSCHAIVVFHQYDLYDPYADMLWWDLMAERQLRGSFLSEVEARDRLRSEQDGAAHLLDDQRDAGLVLGDAS